MCIKMITLYILKLYNAVCQLHLSRAGRKKEKISRWIHNGIQMKLVICKKEVQMTIQH